MVVRGKTQPISVYEILDYHSEETFPRVSDALGLFRDALAKYRFGEFAAAAELFTKVLAINPADRPAKLYIERCEVLKKSPPPSGWRGVWVMEEK